MPISDPEGYRAGHFQSVFDDIFTVACDQAGYEAVRADQVAEINMIHLDVLKRLLNTPMAICDLSSRNPNVLFELGIRQAFDKPVVLVQETGTPRIFDIAPLRAIDYHPSLRYQEVKKAQSDISKALTATKQAPKDSLNSLVRLLGVSGARVKATTDIDPASSLVLAEISALRADVVQTIARIALVDSRKELPRERFLTREDILAHVALDDWEAKLELKASIPEILDARRDARTAVKLTEPSSSARDRHDRLQARTSELIELQQRKKRPGERAPEHSPPTKPGD